MPVFVDIHSHVLYGMDDGARSIGQSLAMLDIAAVSGTTDIVATPHANGRFAFQPSVIAERIAELTPKTRVRIHPGCDFHLQADNITDAVAHPEKYTINHGIYLLVEFPDLTIFPNVDGIFRQLIEAGMVPIISHPERNALRRGQFDDLARWVDAGCCVQVTAASYTGLFGGAARTSAHALLERGLTHFVASDAHDEKNRTPSLKEAYDYMAGHWGEEGIRPLFQDNPRAVLTSDMLDFEPPVRGRQARRWYQFWK
jgi:protein-tyrosine phosphatase